MRQQAVEAFSLTFTTSDFFAHRHDSATVSPDDWFHRSGTAQRTSASATEDRPAFVRECVSAHGPSVCAEGMRCLGVPFQWWERIALPRLVR
jgi:hypothetical protein